MPTQQLCLNVLTFDHPQDQIEVGLYREKKLGMAPLASHEIPLELIDHFPELAENGLQFLYTDFTKPPDADFHATVDLTRSTRFAKHYYSWLIKQYFKGIASVSTPNFIRDNELWFKDKSKSTKELSVFRKFAIRVYINRVTRYPEIVVSFEGHSRVLNKSVLDLDVDSDNLKWVIYNHEKLKYDELSEETRLDYQNVYPVLNNRLRRAMDIPTDHERVNNKYVRYYDYITEFCDQYLNSDQFRQIIPLYSGHFVKVRDTQRGSTTLGSNDLVFGFKKTAINPFYGLRDNGPFSPSPLAHVRMFFIAHEDDAKDAGNKLFKHFRDGYKNFPGLKKFLKIPLNFSKEDQITFKDRENPIPEIKEKLNHKSFDPSVRYIAIYISPIDKNEDDPQKHRVYYLLKEALLKHGITSQVVDRDTVDDPSLNYSLPNIGIAILAKLDGVPWRLNRSLYNELVVGVGAFKPTEALNRYIGSAFCFSNDGRFQGFECYTADDTIMLAGSIRKAVRQYAALHGEVNRLVIHFYKTMSRKEMKPILDELHNLELDIPVIVITINKTESRDLLVFDTNSNQRMPISGTFVIIGRNQYLLCNNTRYSSRSKNVEGYPFPVKISIRSSDETLLKDSKTIQNLIDQVYQFSRMYWKSVRQQNLPVTIKYPEMVAKIFPHFEGETIPPFGKDNLWFL